MQLNEKPLKARQVAYHYSKNVIHPRQGSNQWPFAQNSQATKKKNLHKSVKMGNTEWNPFNLHKHDIQELLKLIKCTEIVILRCTFLLGKDIKFQYFSVTSFYYSNSTRKVHSINLKCFVHITTMLVTNKESLIYAYFTDMDHCHIHLPISRYGSFLCVAMAT